MKSIDQREQDAGKIQAFVRPPPPPFVAATGSTDLASLLPPPPLCRSCTPLFACGQDPLNDPLGKSWSWRVKQIEERRVKQIERWQLLVKKLFKEQIAGEQAATEPKEQIACWPETPVGDWSPDLQTATEPKEQIASEIQELQVAAEPKEQIAGETQALQTATEPKKQISSEIQKLQVAAEPKEQIAGETQALQTATEPKEQIASEIQELQVAAEPKEQIAGETRRGAEGADRHDRQANDETTCEDLRVLLNALLVATEQTVRDLVLQSESQAMVEDSVESIKKLTKEQIAAELQALPAATEPQEQIAGELQALPAATKPQEQIAGEPQALPAATELQEQIAGEPQALPAATELQEQIAGEPQALPAATELQEQIADPSAWEVVQTPCFCDTVCATP